MYTKIHVKLKQHTMYQYEISSKRKLRIQQNLRLMPVVYAKLLIGHQSIPNRQHVWVDALIEEDLQ